MKTAWYQAVFEDFCDYDEQPYTKNTPAEVDFIEQVIGSDKTSRILDVGCGTGRHTVELAARGYAVTGTDLARGQLDRARDKAFGVGLDIEFLEADARMLPFDGEFDVTLLLCAAGFSLMDSDADDVRILASVARALRQGGKLIMTAPHYAYMVRGDGGDSGFDLVTSREAFTVERAGKRFHCTQRYYTCAELSGLLKTIGFDAVRPFAVTEFGYSFCRDVRKDDFEFGVVAAKAIAAGAARNG